MYAHVCLFRSVHPMRFADFNLNCAASLKCKKPLPSATVGVALWVSAAATPGSSRSRRPTSSVPIERPIGRLALRSPGEPQPKDRARPRLSRRRQRSRAMQCGLAAPPTLREHCSRGALKPSGPTTPNRAARSAGSQNLHGVLGARGKPVAKPERRKHGEGERAGAGEVVRS